MRTMITKAAATLTIMSLMAVSTACEVTPREAVAEDEPTINLTANQETIMVGESTTVFAQTANLLGRQVEVQWGTTLGEVETARSGRVAQFSSDVPGTAIVTAELTVNGRTIRDDVEIRVEPMED